MMVPSTSERRRLRGEMPECSEWRMREEEALRSQLDENEIRWDAHDVSYQCE